MPLTAGWGGAYVPDRGPSIVPDNVALDADTWSRLEDSTAEMKSDKFWRDLAAPIDAGLRHLRDEAEAFDKVSAKEYRKQAIRMFEGASEQLEKAAAAGMFLADAALVRSALKQLRGDDDVEEAKQLAEAAAKTKFDGENKAPAGFSGVGIGVTNGTGVAPKPPAAVAPAAPTWDEAAARATPFKWEQDDDGCVTVRIAVPPECAKGDVKVVFGPQRLSVAVAGHPLQPHVIDGGLLYAVRPGECSWALEGKGGKRTLALSLEKAYADTNWVSLLDDEDGRKKKNISEIVDATDSGLVSYGSQ